MKGRYISGGAIDGYIRGLLYEKNGISLFERYTRLSVMLHLGLLTWNEYKHYYESLVIKFGDPPEEFKGDK